MTQQRLHKNKVDYNSHYFWRQFNIRHRDNITVGMPMYSLILKTFFDIVIKKIITEMYQFKFPNIGLFYLIKQKQKLCKDKNGKLVVHASVNWPETKKAGKKIYYLNPHTNRYVYKISWDKSVIDFLNKRFYSFRLQTKHKQYLHSVIMNAEKPLNAYIPWYQ